MESFVAYFFELPEDGQHQLSGFYELADHFPAEVTVHDNGNFSSSAGTIPDGYEFIGGSEFVPTIVECTHRIHFVRKYPFNIGYRCMCRGADTFNKDIKASVCNQCPVRKGR